ncbi:MAG: SRPBCC family protein [Sphingobacterium sp.]|uniref:SRPBCC family protein n=1 Tax=Sphingobacterium sp. JB170 TaxID=1434842 RepID=UPI00097EFA0D|nr:SRPBCC domain-containing protein [Sphingobacterium sp. JB170]SJN20906.1 2-oxoglutarate dehydrogenase complex, dehydrogenase component [Sphingobacterium sp. JB170]
MKIQTIDKTITINAPARKVWQVLWDKDYYKKWAASFTSGSHYTGELIQGGQIQFLDPQGSGMQSAVASLIENREITFHHLHELHAGKKGQSLGSMSERYLLDEQNGVTTLSVKSDMPEEYFSAMGAAMHEALQTVKKLAES